MPMTIQLSIKLYGTLGKWVPGYNPDTGCVVYMAGQSTVADLIVHLGIPPPFGRYRVGQRPGGQKSGCVAGSGPGQGVSPHFWRLNRSLAVVLV